MESIQSNISTTGMTFLYCIVAIYRGVSIGVFYADVVVVSSWAANRKISFITMNTVVALGKNNQAQRNSFFNVSEKINYKIEKNYFSRRKIKPTD